MLSVSHILDHLLLEESFSGVSMPVLGCSVDDEEDEEWEAEDEEAIGRASLAMSLDAMARAQVQMHSVMARHSVLSLSPSLSL